MEDEEIARLTERSIALIRQSKELIEKSQEMIIESSGLKELASQVKDSRKKPL